MPGIRAGLNHSNKHASTSSAQYKGTIAVANGSSLRSATIKKSDTKNITPVVGWYITVAGATGKITGVTTSGANYVVTYSGGNAFSGGLGNPYTIYRG